MFIRIFLFLFLIALNLNAQQFSFNSWSVSEGLAQSQVYALHQDSRGIIWMGTRGGGLSAFDGIRFKNYTSQDGLKDNFILSILETPDKQLWIGSNTGLSKFDGRKFQAVSFTNVGSPAVECMLFSKQLGLLIGTSRGLYVQNGNKFVALLNDAEELKSGITDLHEDDFGNVWIASPAGLSRYNGKAYKFWNVKSGLLGNNIRTISSDVKNRIWIGFYGESIGILKDDSVIRFPVNLDAGDGIIHNLIRDHEGKIWIGTQSNGIGCWNPADGSLRFYTERDGLANNHVRSIIEDNCGNIWVGTSGGGVSKFSGQDFIHYNQKSGLSGRNVYAIAEDTSGAIWFSTSAGGISILKENQIKDLSSVDGLPKTKVKKLFVDVSGRLWIGTEGEGLYLKDSEVISRFGLSNGLRGNWIRDIIQDAAGNIWIAKAGGGISCMIESNRGVFSFKHFDSKNGLPDDRINQLLLLNSRIWFATSNAGIGYIENDSIYNFNLSDGLSSLKIRSISAGKSNDIWVGTADKGLNHVEFNGKNWLFKSVNSKNGLSSDNIYLLQLDARGQLWVGSEKGLDRLSFSVDGLVQEIRHFSSNEGFVGVETSQNACLSDTKGRLWFGTINGLTCCNPASTRKNNNPPLLRFTNLSIAYQPINLTPYANALDGWNNPLKPIILPYNKNQISFEFQGINHSNPEQVKYQWKLEGLEENWSPADFRNNITYSSLSPGEYTFLVRACNEDGVWSKPLQISLKIKSPIWREWWFIVSGLVSIILIFWLYFRSRIKRIKRKSFEAQQKLKTESELLKLEQKALQLQMNPHFIFNALNSVQSLIGSEDEKTARFQLSRFSRLMRQILESSREELIPLQLEINILENYLNLENFIHGNHFKFEFVIDGNYQPEEVLIPAMMVHPFVENAVIHGLSNKKDGHIEIRFIIDETHLTAIITDNGVGREKAKLNNLQRDPSHKSTALLVVEERLKLFSTSGKPEITDLYDHDNQPSGTQVKIVLPVKHVF